MLVQNTLAVSTLTPGGGGFDAQLPKGTLLPSWSYKEVSNISNNTLTTFTGFNALRLQIDCYANTPVDALNLAEAINKVLDGYQGTLPDPDHTFVSSCFSCDRMNFFDPDYRSYRRMLEFEILYSDS